MMNGEEAAREQKNRKAREHYKAHRADPANAAFYARRNEECKARARAKRKAQGPRVTLLGLQKRLEELERIVKGEV